MQNKIEQEEVSFSFNGFDEFDELGKITGISKQDLNRIEEGKIPTLEQLNEILKVWPELNKHYGKY